MTVEDALDFLKMIAPAAGPDAIHAHATLSREIQTLRLDQEGHMNLIRMLRKRFPAREDGSLPDFTVEEVLKENERLKDALFKESQAHADACVDIGILCREVGLDVADYKQVHERVKQLKTWISDLQSGMFVNCVYCGHRYGPKGETPVVMADVLKQHIAECPQHPLAAVTAALRHLLQRNDPDTRAVAERVLKSLPEPSWTEGENPSSIGTYWVCLANEPGRVRLFFYEPQVTWMRANIPKDPKGC